MLPPSAAGEADWQSNEGRDDAESLDRMVGLACVGWGEGGACLRGRRWKERWAVFFFFLREWWVGEDGKN